MAKGRTRIGGEEKKGEGEKLDLVGFIHWANTYSSSTMPETVPGTGVE